MKSSATGIPRAMGLTIVALMEVMFGAAHAGSSHELSLSKVTGLQGQTVSIQASYTSTDSVDTVGWSFGVQHDPLLLTHEGATATPALLALAPEHVLIEEWAFGWTADIVLAFDGTTVLPAGSSIDLIEAQYVIEGSCSDTAIPVEFTGELGFPFVPVEVSTTAGVVTPVTASGSVMVVGTSEFVFIAPDATVPEAGTATLSFSILETDAPYQDSAGLAMGLSSDPSVVRPVSVDESALLIDLIGQPFFFQGNALDTGWTVGIVYGSFYFIQFSESLALIDVTYEAQPGSVGLTTPLIWTATLGMPPVPNVVVVSGQPMPACGVTGSITVVDQYGFLRGDTNGDGTVDIADPIALLIRLFEGGAPSSCLEADDVNDDGSVDVADPIALLYYVVLGATPPPPPSPSCGYADAQLGCDEEACP